MVPDTVGTVTATHRSGSRRFEGGIRQEIGASGRRPNHHRAGPSAIRTGTRSNEDFYIAVQQGNAEQQALAGKAAKFVAVEFRHMRLRNAQRLTQPFGRRGPGKSFSLQQVVQSHCQLHPKPALVRVGQAQIHKHIAGAGFNGFFRFSRCGFGFNLHGVSCSVVAPA